ncbi:MAG TPA: four helix bundle protein [Patescibacteria group bacterium]
MDKGNKGYHKLIVWQRAKQLIVLVYKNTDSFPKSEEFGLKGQLRRAVVSVALTIVEGYRRSSRRDFLHFLNIAEASLAEVEAALEISLDLEFFKIDAYNQIEEKRREVAYLLHQLIKSLK